MERYPIINLKCGARLQKISQNPKTRFVAHHQMLVKSIIIESWKLLINHKTGEKEQMVDVSVQEQEEVTCTES